jgi:hypothetical protein
MPKKGPEIRLSLAIIALSGFVISKGVDCVNQALAASSAGGQPPDATDQRVGRPLPAETGTKGIELYARAARAMPALAQPLTLKTVDAAGDAVADVLEVWPLAGPYWVRLAEIRAASGADLSSAIAAYQISVVVAPFDGGMMLAREVLGVGLWDVLSADDRRSVVTDLTGAWTLRQRGSVEQLRRATGSLSPNGRKTLKHDLKARSRLADADLATIGL